MRVDVRFHPGKAKWIYGSSIEFLVWRVPRRSAFVKCWVRRLFKPLQCFTTFSCLLSLLVGFRSTRNSLKSINTRSSVNSVPVVSLAKRCFSCTSRFPSFGNPRLHHLEAISLPTLWFESPINYTHKWVIQAWETYFHCNKSSRSNKSPDSWVAHHFHNPT